MQKVTSLTFFFFVAFLLTVGKSINYAENILIGVSQDG